MSEKHYDDLSPEEFGALKKEYESQKKRNLNSVYFDVNQLEALLDYYIEMNQYDDVKYLINIAEKIHPGAIGIKIRKSKYFFAKGNIQKAWNLLEEVQMFEPSLNEVYLLKGMILVMEENVQKADKMFSKAVQLSDENSPEIYYTIATTLETAKYYKLALKYFRLAWKNSGFKDYDLLYDLAYCSEKAGKVSSSNKYYMKYLDKNPFVESAWYNLGVNYFNIDKYQNAIEAFNYSLTIDPDYVPPMKAKAQCNIKLENYAEALKIYKKVEKKVNPDPEVFYEIGEVYRKTGKKREAEKYLRKSVTLDVNCSEAWYSISLIKYDEGKYMEGILNIKNALKKASFDPEYWHALALYYSKIGFIEDSESAFEKAVKIDPEESDFWINYSEMEHKIGETQKAINILKRAELFNKDSADLKYRIAAYYLEQNHENSAKKYLLKACEIDNDPSSFFNYYPNAQYMDDIMSIFHKIN